MMRPIMSRDAPTRLAMSCWVSSTFGTARDVTLEELAIESFFPADAATADALRVVGS